MNPRPPKAQALSPRPSSRSSPRSFAGDLFSAPVIHRDEPINGLPTNTPTPAPTPVFSPLSVDELIGRIDTALTQKIGIVRVRGEVSGFNAYPSGHWYFQLKGQEHLIKCVMFRAQTLKVKVPPQQGMMVEITAQVGLYRSRGELQLQVSALAPAGEGALYAAFVALRTRLIAEGLFAPERKKPLPFFPKTVGIISSPSAAGLHDVLKILRDHSSHVAVVIYPSLVQGPLAAQELIRALHTAENHGVADVLMMVRGGGAMEDLWCFNDEALARAVCACPIPTIAGVGHETDTTLIDDAVDVRAPTPSAAARLITATDEQGESLDRLNQRLNQFFQRQWREAQQSLDTAWRVFRAQRERYRPATLIPIHSRLIDAWQNRVHAERTVLIQAKERWQPLMRALLTMQNTRQAHLTELIKAYDPKRAQRWGYALMSQVVDGQERWVESAEGLLVGQSLAINVRDAIIYANVTAIEKKRATPPDQH